MFNKIITQKQIDALARGRMMGDHNRGNPAWNRGVPRTDEEKRKMSDNRKGLPAWNKGLKTGVGKFCEKGHEKNGKRSCYVCFDAEYRRDMSYRNRGVLNANGNSFTVTDYDRAYQIQQGRCIGCKRHQSELKGKLHADHNHETGKFRWLLCSGCNTTLGLVKENPEILRALADLLEAA